MLTYVFGGFANQQTVWFGAEISSWLFWPVVKVWKQVFQNMASLLLGAQTTVIPIRILIYTALRQ